MVITPTQRSTWSQASTRNLITSPNLVLFPNDAQSPYYDSVTDTVEKSMLVISSSFVLGHNGELLVITPPLIIRSNSLKRATTEVFKSTLYVVFVLTRLQAHFELTCTRIISVQEFSYSLGEGST